MRLELYQIRFDLIVRQREVVFVNEQDFDEVACLEQLVPCLFATPSNGYTSMTSPMSIRATSISKGKAPASSIVLKKMGAILPPMQTEPARLFGTQGTCVW